MLREMLGFKESKFWNLEPANVTNRNSSSVRTIMIDIGVNDSIYKDNTHSHINTIHPYFYYYYRWIFPVQPF